MHIWMKRSTFSKKLTYKRIRVKQLTLSWKPPAMRIRTLHFFYLDNETAAMAYLKETFTDHTLVSGLVAGTAAVGAGGPVVLVGLGFTKAGVTLGSIGATLMSTGSPRRSCNLPERWESHTQPF